MSTHDYALEIQNLHVHIQDKELLHGVDLTVPNGEVHTLLGMNGSGKTSLMMAIMGFSAYKITQGRILFNGEDITDMSITERAKKGLGLASQRPPAIPGVTLRQILNHPLSLQPNRSPQIAELVSAARMDDFIERDVNKGLSGGEIRRSELLQLLCAQPLFSLLDEPDSGVDIESLALVGTLINQLVSYDSEHPVQRHGALIITHNGSVMDYVHVDKAHVMVDGRIVCSGNPHLILESITNCGYAHCASCMCNREG